MKTILEQMIEAYQPKNNEEKRNVIKEVMQEITLCALSKAGFFDVAAFYGGTALRIFYGLDRFSEDLDFSLMTKNKDFDLSTYVPSLKRIEQFLLFYPNDLVTGINKNEKVKIKFEIDTMPAGLATYETKYRLLPLPYSIKLYDEASLFSGKIHAVICRSWKSRVKGRDLYDYVFYLTRNTKFNLDHLREKLIESHYISQEDRVDVNFVKALLIARFNEIDFNDAKKDVLPFIKDTSILDIWSKEFFIAITSKLSNR